MPEILEKPVPNPLAKNPNFYTHKVFATVGLILIGVIVLLLGAAIIFRVNLNDLLGNINFTENKVASSSAKSDKTENWKTYTDENITFKYPLNWKTIYSKDASTAEIIDVEPLDRKNYETSFNTLLITKAANPKNLTIEQIIHRDNSSGISLPSQFADSSIEKKENILVDGENGIRYYLNESSTPTQDETYVLHEGYVYNFENNGGVAFRDTYSQILSTFKFIKSTTIFLKQGATQANADSLAKDLNSIKGVTKVRVTTPDEALAIYKEENKAHPELINTAEIFPNTIEVTSEESVADQVKTMAKQKSFVESVNP